MANIARSFVQPTLHDLINGAGWEQDTHTHTHTHTTQRMPDTAPGGGYGGGGGGGGVAGVGRSRMRTHLILNRCDLTEDAGRWVWEVLIGGGVVGDGSCPLENSQKSPLYSDFLQ
jgi:hypothetical protein